MNKERCRCGNRVPMGELKAGGGVCRACAREAIEKRQIADEQRHFRELKARYLSQHPFYAYMPEDE